MTEFLFEEFDQDFAKARETAQQACKNPLYQEYVAKRGPLYLGEVGQVSPEFEAVYSKYGWPEEVDGVIKTVPLWESDTDFMKSLQEGGRMDISMNPILHTLGAPLIDEFGEAKRGIDFYGAMPYLHRAHALAPDLIDSVRTIVNTMADRYRHHKLNFGSGEFLAQLALYEQTGKVDRSDDPVLAAYLRPENRDMCEAIHVSYKLMARLLKVDDPARITGDRSSATRFTDASTALLGRG